MVGRVGIGEPVADIPNDVGLGNPARSEHRQTASYMALIAPPIRSYGFSFAGLSLPVKFAQHDKSHQEEH